MLLALRVQLMLNIVMGAHNESIEHVQTLLEENEKCVRRNPRINKKKEMKSPFTAPSTRTLMQRVGEEPLKKKTKTEKAIVVLSLKNIETFLNLCVYGLRCIFSFAVRVLV
ncbi:uncharacterized protein DS421_16g537490 [Arachis hypogaea]|nr:uncharacterized protein DS421_16g537490 [Arachis hypogaea]